MPRPLFTPRKDLVPIVQEAGWAQGPFWTSAENLAPTWIRFLDRPARSQSLYRLRYTAHIPYGTCQQILREESVSFLRACCYIQFYYQPYALI